MNDQTNQQLVESILAGSDPALAALVQRHLPLVYGISLRYLRNQADAEDATQDIFIKIWKNLKKFDTEKSFEAWAGRIARNTCLDMLKKKQAIPFTAFENDAGENAFMESLTAVGPTPFEVAERSSLGSLLRGAIGKLAPAYQKVLSLYYDRGLNFREIAEETGEPLDTVKSRHRRAIILLKKLLSGV